MSKKIYIIAVLIIILIGFSIFEVNYAKNTITNLQSELVELKSAIGTQIDDDNINTESISLQAEESQAYWNQRESILCLIFNHNDMKEIGKEITQIISYLEQQDLQEAFVHTDLAIQQVTTLTHLIQFNIQNIL